ncbi:MAG TPA: hypothetical protein VGW34_15520 [Allosphingosinicella sp.]|nr:hypothetical protein [Allosphingosinicella sp.]
MSAGIVDVADVVAVTKGDWNDAVLVVLQQSQPTRDVRAHKHESGDPAFLSEVRRTAPNLADLAARTVTAIRALGVDGNLVKSRLGRWVNQPLNSFTLKAQPRAGNLHFTLYGNPSSYEAEGFLLQDQNSYSRGWVRNPDDVNILARLVQQAHTRRRG